MTLMTYMSSDSSLCSDDCLNNYERIIIGIVRVVNPLVQKRRIKIVEVSCKGTLKEKSTNFLTSNNR